MKLKGVFLILVLCFLSVGTVSAANLTVNPGGSIQSVINAASFNDTIIVNDNNGSAYTYTENLVINKTLQLKASTGKNVTIRPSNLSSIVTVNPGVTVTFSNLIFANGNYASNQGGAIYNRGNLTVINCTFRNNTAYNGGAICNGGNLTVTGSTFTGNTAIHDGGAINNVNSLTVNNCVFINNVAQHVCGAIINWMGNMAVTGSIFTGNTAAEEESAIGNYYGTSNINFNRILTSGNYGLYNANGGVVNATNNWWGSNNGPVISSTVPGDIRIVSGTVTYNPWLVLNVTSTPNEIYGSEAVLTADLNHNNNGDNTLPHGNVPDGIPVNFATNCGNITNTAYTRNGKATTILNNLQSGTANVTSTLDNQSVSTQVTKQIAQALLNITAGNVLVLPYPCTTGLNINYGINLTNPVTWVSVVYRHVDEPGVGEIDIIVNGNIVLTKYFVNSYFFWMDNEEWWCNYPDPSIWGLELNPDLFMDYARRLNFAEQNGLDFGAICHEMYNNPYLTDGDSYMAYYHRDSFKDNIQTILTYPGGSLNKNSTITYINGPPNDPETCGFEIIQSFAITTGKVTDDMVQYWLNQNSTYSVGHMKAAYGTFMTSLTTLWLSDKIAVEISENLNGTWSRITPTGVMSGVTGGKAYVHCPDPSMGMSFFGDESNLRLFRFVCSLMLSEVEHVALGSAGSSVNSTLLAITSAILNGEEYKIIFNEDNTAIFMLEGDQRFKIIIDLETGLVKEILDTGNFQYKGAETVATGYCYHDQLTEDTTRRTKAFLDAFKWGGVESTGGGLLITAGLIAFGACPPLGIAMLGIGLFVTADASGLTQDPTNPYNWLDFGVSAGLSLAGPEGVTLKQTINPVFRQGMRYMVENEGYKTIVRATVGNTERSAIKGYYNNYVTGSSISGMINMYRPENN